MKVKLPGYLIQLFKFYRIRYRGAVAVHGLHFVAAPAYDLAVGRGKIAAAIYLYGFPSALGFTAPFAAVQELGAGDIVMAVRPLHAFALAARSLPGLFYDIIGKRHNSLSLSY
jgi:hypothetical protein